MGFHQNSLQLMINCLFSAKKDQACCCKEVKVEEWNSYTIPLALYTQFSHCKVYRRLWEYQKVYFALTESSSWWEASLRESFPGRLWGPQCPGPCFLLWTHFSILEGYGSQVSICVSALLCLQFNWQIRTTQGSLLGARHPSLLPPSHHQVCAFWHMSQLKLLWMDMFLGRNLPQTPTTLPNSRHSLVDLLWFDSLDLLPWPLLSLQITYGIPGKHTLDTGSQCHILERELSLRLESSEFALTW